MHIHSLIVQVLRYFRAFGIRHSVIAIDTFAEEIFFFCYFEKKEKRDCHKLHEESVYSSIVRLTKKADGEDRAEEGEEGGEKMQGSGMQCAAQYGG